MMMQSPVQDKTPLRLALDKFNAVFGDDLTLPMWPETVRAAAELAKLRGRADIAAELLAALT